MSPKTFVSVFLAIACGISGVASAASIGVNFNGGAGYSPRDLAPTDSAGVVAQTNWMNVLGTSGSNLTLSNNSGAATTAKVTYASGGSSGTFGGSNVNQRIYNEGLDTASNTAKITVSVANVPYAAYDLYLYTFNSNLTGRVGKYSLVGGTSYYVKDGLNYSPGNAFVRSTDTTGAGSVGNYVLFSGLTAPSFSLEAIGISYTGGSTIRATVEGIQIVGVPEPSSLCLLGLGCLALLKRHRRA